MMDIRIFQINMDRDKDGLIFSDHDRIEKWSGKVGVDASIYDLVYAGKIDGADLEDVYREFNFGEVEDYTGRSLSVSDVVEVKDGAEEENGFYYCDRYGFKKIDFDPDLAEVKFNQKITVVMVEPGKRAEVTEIGTDLMDLQEAVEGCIETYYPFPNDGVKSSCCIVCNDEGKINGMRPNRAMYGDDHEIVDIIFGPFFICDCSGENFGSLSEAQIDTFMKEYQNPERFFRSGGQIVTQTYVPMIERKEEGR